MKAIIGIWLLVFVLICSFFVVFDPFHHEIEEGFTEDE